MSSFFNAVIPVEETEFIDTNRIKILKQMQPAQFIREPGSDIRKGEVVIQKD